MTQVDHRHRRPNIGKEIKNIQDKKYPRGFNKYLKDFIFLIIFKPISDIPLLSPACWARVEILILIL